MKAIYWSKLLIIYLFLFYAAVGILNFIIDPYQHNNLFTTSLNINKYATKNYTFSKHINDLNDNKYTLIFGTSRSYRINTDMANDQVIMLNYVSGNPFCVNKFLNSLNKRQISNINAVIYGLSNHQFKTTSCNRKVNYVGFPFLPYFTFSSTKQSIRTIFNNLTNNKKLWLNENIVNIYGTVTASQHLKLFNPSKISTLIYNSKILSAKKEHRNIIEPFKELNKVEKFMNKNSIEVLYFTDIYTDYFFSILNLDDLIRFNKNITNNLDVFYAFNYIDGFSNDHSNFSDESHLTTKGLKFIFDHYMNKKYQVSHKNIDKYIGFLKSNHIASKEKIKKKYITQ